VNNAVTWVIPYGCCPRDRSKTQMLKVETFRAGAVQDKEEDVFLY